jgi:NAD(P)-dependent dehydrogenase (short-subunit alcohol dehydrogenase family)
MAFANKHVLITGGSEGLGLALAKQLASQNARVTLVARTLSKLEAAEHAVLASYPQQQQQQQRNDEQLGPQLVYYHSADVTKYKQVSTCHSFEHQASLRTTCACLPVFRVSP